MKVPVGLSPHGKTFVAELLASHPRWHFVRRIIPRAIKDIYWYANHELGIGTAHIPNKHGFYEVQEWQRHERYRSYYHMTGTTCFETTKQFVQALLPSYPYKWRKK